MDQRCAVLARTVDEPLAGTAPVATGWVCLEHRGGWPRDVGAHPDPQVAAFAARVTASGRRLLLVRRPDRPRDTAGPNRVLLADTAPGRTALHALSVDGPDDLAGVPLPPPGAPLPGERLLDPVLLVCTHGRRDRCCALDGRALALAVAAGGEVDVWESSHLGGHRFAPTALVLPTGYAYGRLDPDTAVAACKAAAAGEVEAALCRGRSTWSAAAQVAELAVRAATGLRDADALAVDEATGGEVLVRASDGRRWRVAVREEDGPARPASCGAAVLASRALRAAAVAPA